jgi:hypothetical protein
MRCAEDAVSGNAIQTHNHVAVPASEKFTMYGAMKHLSHPEPPLAACFWYQPGVTSPGVDIYFSIADNSLTRSSRDLLTSFCMRYLNSGTCPGTPSHVHTPAPEAAFRKPSQARHARTKRSSSQPPFAPLATNSVVAGLTTRPLLPGTGMTYSLYKYRMH